MSFVWQSKRAFCGLIDTICIQGTSSAHGSACQCDSAGLCRGSSTSPAVQEARQTYCYGNK